MNAELIVKTGAVIGLAAACAACPMLTWFLGVGIVAAGAAAAKR